MKKVVFSVTNARNQSDKKLSSFGYITEGNLLCPCISKNNKPYIRIFEDVEKRCRPVQNRSGEFQGYVTIYFTAHILVRACCKGNPNRNGSFIEIRGKMYQPQSE